MSMLSMTTLNPDHFDCSVTFGELVANGGRTTDVTDETGMSAADITLCVNCGVMGEKGGASGEQVGLRQDLRVIQNHPSLY